MRPINKIQKVYESLAPEQKPYCQVYAIKFIKSKLTAII